MPTFIDVFAGAGGLSEGFIQQGFTPLAHVEREGAACLTLRTRMAYHHLRRTPHYRFYKAYLHGAIDRSQLYALVPGGLLDGVITGELSDSSAEELLGQVAERVAAAGVARVDVLLGGAPCQAYSHIGRYSNRKMTADDPRLGLYRHYVQFLRRFTPSVFVFENVLGIRSVDGGRVFADLKSAISAEGYRVTERVVDATDYGVLQKRRRIIVLGWRKRLHLDVPEFPVCSPDALVADLMADLPAVTPGEDGSGRGYAASGSRYLRDTGLRRDDDVLTLHRARPHNEADRAIYAEAIRLWRQDRTRLRYQNLAAELRTRRNVTSFTDRYKVVAADLPYSHTVLAHIANDGHYYIHPDAEQRRSLTVREAARLQSFPDNYFFEGDRAPVFRQIGNAVPPLLSRAVAASIRRVIS